MVWSVIILVILALLVGILILRRRAISKPLSQRELLIAQVSGTHRAWYPAHNEGRQAPEKAVESWINTLSRSGLSESELLLLVADNKARNQLLGKSWP